MAATLPAFGINLVASVSADMGLGVSARALAHALAHHGVPFVVADVKAPALGRPVPLGFDAPRVASDADLRYPVNLYAITIDGVAEVVQAHAALLARRRLHVASLYWEVSSLPPAWIAGLSRFDAVLAASGFIAHLMADGLPLTPVIEAPHPLVLPAGIAPDRARFGLPPGATVFTVSFDPNSDPARKNPFGAIQAFRAAFPAAVRDVHLAIRMHHADSPNGRATLPHLQHLAAGDPRIGIQVAPLDYAGVLALYASSDAYVSLHRGEGLGLGLMESMALGKPVIATAWSGNASFMDFRCACPVRYRQVAIKANLPFLKPEVLGERAFWAEPLLEDAVAWMRRLHAEPALRAALGAEAARAMGEYQARAWRRDWIDQVEALWRAHAHLPALPGKFSGMGTA